MADPTNSPYYMMNQLLAGRIQSLIAGARNAGFNITPGSGYRSEEEQAKLRTENGCPDVWNSPASACRVPTAIPGHSNHNHGLAMDLNFGGNKAAAAWANEHGADYGLVFPVRGEDWHVELDPNSPGAGQVINDAMAQGAIGTNDLHTTQNPTDVMATRLQDMTKILSGGDYLQGTQTPDGAGVDTASAIDLSPHPDTTSLTVQHPYTNITIDNPHLNAGTNQWSGKDVPPAGYVPPGQGVQRWSDVASAALAYTGQDQRFLPLLLKRMAQESGGNPAAVNNWDSNAMRGDPTTGLMQNIPSAWTDRAQELAGRGITDGFANIVASIRYTLQRYGTLAAWGRKGGY